MQSTDFSKQSDGRGDSGAVPPALVALCCGGQSYMYQSGGGGAGRHEGMMASAQKPAWLQQKSKKSVPAAFHIRPTEKR